MITIPALLDIAKKVEHESWGLGYPPLVANSESWAPYLRFLHAVMAEFGMKTAVECGVYMGTATEHMILSSPDSLVIGIDRNFHPAYINVFDRHPGNVVFICADTTDLAVVDRVSEILGGRSVDMLFIDSTHDYDTPKKEFELYSQFLSEEALVCCDDILYERMPTFWEWLPGDKIQLNDLHVTRGGNPPVGFGVSIIRRIS